MGICIGNRCTYHLSPYFSLSLLHKCIIRCSLSIRITIMALPYGPDLQFGITKKIIFASSKELPEFKSGMKLVYHFEAKRSDDEGTILDDSRKLLSKPMELILGKQFKLEAWEKCLQTMREGEVSQFVVNKAFVTAYPTVSKSLRDHAKKERGGKLEQEEPRSHCCGMMALHKFGMGYEDLDEIMHNPEDLKFTFELLKVENPGDYEKEAWAMDVDEKLDSVPRLREEGNELYNKKKYDEAATKYSEALGRIEQLILREKPGDEEWEKLDKMKIPLLLNFSQCKLLDKDYYPVIEHTTTVLQKNPDNVKALFRRAKAHVGAWNPEEAIKDFEKVAQLDSSLAATVKKELSHIDVMKKEKDAEDKAKLKGKLFKSPEASSSPDLPHNII